MSKVNLVGWNKKTKTALRSTKPGDIFMFPVNDNLYCIGRIISDVSLGHVAEIFDLYLETPDVGSVDFDSLKRVDYLDNEVLISDQEAKKFPAYSAEGEVAIKEFMQNRIL